MNLQRAKEHAEMLREFAQQTQARSALEPNNFLLQLVAKNQLDAANEAELAFLTSKATQESNAIEWRLIGDRTRNGRIPLGMLAKLADPLNKLILRASFFARNKEDAVRGVGETFSNEMGLRLAGLAEGSVRLIIVGNTMPDATGVAPLIDGMDRVMSALESGEQPSVFFESIGEIGEMAASSLHDVLKAVEQEECSVEVKWYVGGESKIAALRFDEVVRMRTMLEGSASVVEEEGEVAGVIGLLASSGRIQIVQASGAKTNVRFIPKKQGDWVSRLRLNQTVTLKTSAKVFKDPATGEVTRVHRLTGTEPI